jgi:effector-binding domain-containing protein
MTQSDETPYFLADPHPSLEILDATAVPTVVRKVTDHPLSDMSTLFDSTFSALFPALEQAGLHPTGPAFSLHRRMPTDTATFEIGIPVDRALAAPVTAGPDLLLEASELPGGPVATVSHLGSYDELGQAWEAFLGSVTTAGRRPALPFWEIYVTEPGPDVDPATLRTDLVTALEG